MIRQPSEWEKIIANEATDKELISKIYKQILQIKDIYRKEPFYTNKFKHFNETDKFEENSNKKLIQEETENLIAVHL